MKRIMLISLALLILAGSAAASQLCGNVGLDQYIANYNGISNACQVGDKLYYDFTYSAVFDSGPGPDASELTVVPDPDDGISNPGLIFSVGGFLVFAGNTLDAVIRYNIGTLSGSAVIDGYSLSTAGSHTQSTGGGFGTVTESFSNNPAGTPLLTQAGPYGFNVNSAHIDFSPYVSVATVTTHIHLESPSNGSDIVTISAIQEHFSEELPEPNLTVLTGFGLLLIGLRRKRALGIRWQRRPAPGARQE